MRSEAGRSIGQRIFLATVSLVFVSLGLTTLVYFFVFSESSRQLIEDQSTEINKQIVFNYERYINSVIDTAGFLQLAVSTRDIGTDEEALQELFVANSQIKQELASVFLFSVDGAWLLGNPLRPVPALRERDWFASALAEPEIYHFSIAGTINLDLSPDDEVIAVSRKVNFLRDGSLTSGVLLVELDSESIVDLSERTNLGESGHILILDDQNELVYASADNEYTRASLPVAAETYLGGVQTRIQDLEMYVHANTLAQTRWRIITVSNVDDLTGARERGVVIIAVIAAASLVVTGFAAGLISLRISRPINQLESIMARIESGDFHTTIDVRGQREIVQLSRSFNKMVVRVRQLMDQLVDEQRDKRKTELRALQNQINPHFLYNTLDSIVWLAEHNRNEDVVTTVVALARLFRISISKGETFITIREEIEHVENYLTIQSMRYVDKFDYEIDVDDTMLDNTVMKLILQPIVENAIYHGMGDERGRITIRGSAADGASILEVSNTGYGLTEAQIEEITQIMQGRHERPGVGLRNVYQRLKLTYGDAADITITSEIDESTTFRLVVPSTLPEGSRSHAPALETQP
jgi:two-component system sensor histidine kinase YesM